MSLLPATGSPSITRTITHQFVARMERRACGAQCGETHRVARLKRSTGRPGFRDREKAVPPSGLRRYGTTPSVPREQRRKLGTQLRPQVGADVDHHREGLVELLVIRDARVDEDAVVEIPRQVERV